MLVYLFIKKKTEAGQHHEKNGENQREISRDEFLSGMPGKANELLQEYSYIWGLFNTANKQALFCIVASSHISKATSTLESLMHYVPAIWLVEIYLGRIK